MPYVGSDTTISGGMSLKAVYSSPPPFPYTITAGTASQITSGTVYASAVAAQALDDGYALCVFGGDYAVVDVTANAVTTVSTGSTGYTQYTSGDTYACAVGGGVILGFGTAANANAYGYGDIESFIQESVNKIDGLTKEKCTSAVAGDVWKLA